MLNLYILFIYSNFQMFFKFFYFLCKKSENFVSIYINRGYNIHKKYIEEIFKCFLSTGKKNCFFCYISFFLLLVFRPKINKCVLNSGFRIKTLIFFQQRHIAPNTIQLNIDCFHTLQEPVKA